MLLQTNSYIVPKEKRAAHASLLLRFRETLARLGCDVFEIYEQAGTHWDVSQSSGRFVQIMRFRDREHQRAVQAAETSDREAQLLIAEFCELINFPYQQEHGFFAVGFYTNILSSEALSEDGIDDAPIAGLDDDNDDPNFRQNESPDARSSPMRLVPSDSFVTESDAADDDRAGESGFGIVLDAGMIGDALDVPLPAELIEDEPIAAPPVDLRINPKQSVKRVSGRR